MNIEIYKYEYPNGFVQIKYVITKDDYINLIKPIKDEIDLSDDKEFKLSKKKEIDSILGVSIDLFYDLVVEGSRMHSPIRKDGLLDPFFEGGPISSVKVSKIEKGHF